MSTNLFLDLHNRNLTCGALRTILMNLKFRPTWSIFSFMLLNILCLWSVYMFLGVSDVAPGDTKIYTAVSCLAFLAGISSSFSLCLIIPIVLVTPGVLNAYLAISPGWQYISCFVAIFWSLGVQLRSIANYKQEIVNDGSIEKLALMLILVQLVSTVVGVQNNLTASLDIFSFNGLKWGMKYLIFLGNSSDYANPLRSLFYIGSAAALLTSVNRNILLDQRFKRHYSMSTIVAGGIILFSGIIDSIYRLPFRRLPSYINGFMQDAHSFSSIVFVMFSLGIYGIFLFLSKRKAFHLLSSILLCIVSLWLINAAKSKSTFAISLIGLLALIISNYKNIIKIKYSKLILVSTFSTAFLALPYTKLWHRFDRFAKTDLDWKQINQLFSHRPGVFAEAVRLWWEQPIFGIGAGVFTWASGLKGSMSEYLLSKGGEHAHNYFLQQLAEGGIISLAAWLLITAVLIQNFFQSRYKFYSIAAIAIIVGGNLVAHSLLLPTILIFFSALLALALNRKPVLYAADRYIKVVIACALAMIFHRFIYRNSSASPIFFAGIKCNSANKWHDGQISNGAVLSVGNRLKLRLHNPNIGLAPVKISISWLKDSKVISVDKIEVASHKIVSIENIMQAEQAQINADRCFSPLSHGISMDDRRLAVQIIR